MGEAYIVAAARTAGGRRGGKLKEWHPVDLGAQVINSLLDRAGANPDLIEDVICGCVSQVGQQAINVARNAVMASRLPESVPATSVDRQCGSSQQALHFAAQAVMSGAMDCAIAMGIESMTRVPMGLSATLAMKEGFGSYMSPEQTAARHGLVDHRTDIYSLGATLYELLTHEPLFPARERGALVEQIVHDEPRPPRSLRPAIPVALETIVLKCLAKEPAGRFATARELAEDLHRFLSDQPIRARRYEKRTGETKSAFIWDQPGMRKQTAG